MKKRISTIAFVILFVAGLSLLLYPLVADRWNTYRQSQLMNSYEEIVEEQVALGNVSYEAELKRAEKYNADLLPALLPDAFAIQDDENPDPEYMACLNLAGDDIMGTIEIPKIGIKIPVFHTTKDSVLQVAAGHLAGSSLPIGGETTHTVISAHRGLPSAALFTDLDKLVEGDHFVIRVLDQTLCYEVDLISVIEPTDTTALQIEKGKDYATLMTCTPYGVNSHRLLVRGHRVEYVEEEIEEEIVPLGTFGTGASLHTNYLLWVVVGLSITGLFVLILVLRERKLRKKAMKE